MKPSATKHMRRVVLVYLGLLIITCTAPCCIHNKRSSPDSSAIGIDVLYKSGSRYYPLTFVTFIKIDPAHPDIYFQKKTIGSNMTWNGHVHLLNAKPGRYIAVAGFDSTTTRDYRGKDESTISRSYFFTKEMIALTVIDLKPAEFRYMGYFLIDHMGKPGMKDLYKIRNADAAQLHYCGIIAPQRARPSVGSCIYSEAMNALTAPNDSDSTYAAKLISRDKSEEANQRFLRAALGTLSGTEWAPLIRKQMR